MPNVTNSFSAVGVGTSFTPGGPFNCELRGNFDAMVSLERSLDGTNFVPLSVDFFSGSPNSFTRPTSMTVSEVEATAVYRWNCTRWVSGTVQARLSN